MYEHEKVYRSAIYFLQQLAPSGITVADGESYGVRLDDPTNKVGSITVTLPDSVDAGLELGSFSTIYTAYITINGVSRQQRDALKTIVYSGFMYNQIPIYNNFNQFTPTGEIEKYAQLGTYFSIKDMPNFDSDRERFFWVAVATTTLNVLGI